MKVIYATGTTRLNNIVAAIGIFDGLHRGHQFLLSAMQQEARRLKASSAVITFFPHPAHVLRPDIALDYVVSMDHRLKLLEKSGIDFCIVVKFTKAFAGIAPEKFIKNTLVKQFGVKAIFVGEDFRFGKDRSGGIELFQQCADKYGYTMHPVHALMQGGLAISSTRIRHLVTAGQLKSAQQILGRPFSKLGTVVKGDGRGKTLGYPTANVQYDQGILPPNGVYVVRARVGEKIYPAVANLGVRPSIAAKLPQKPILEVHVLNKNIHLYGKTIEVEFCKLLRPEKKFPTLDALIAQIRKDEQKAKAYFKR